MTRLLTTIWNPANYWLAWLAAFIGSFLVREIWALASGRPQDTLSDRIWIWLKIHPGESVLRWSAGDLLTFGVYIIIFVCWLPWHFWFGRFR